MTFLLKYIMPPPENTQRKPETQFIFMLNLYVQILGFICIGIMINVLSERGFEFMFKVFIICSICLALFTIGFHFACLLEWEADGRLIMARIGYVSARGKLTDLYKSNIILQFFIFFEI